MGPSKASVVQFLESTGLHVPARKVTPRLQAAVARVQEEVESGKLSVMGWDELREALEDAGIPGVKAARYALMDQAVACRRKQRRAKRPDWAPAFPDDEPA